MKLIRVTCCLFVLLVSLVAFAFTTGVPRAHAASGNTFEFKFHGLSAQANFDNVSPDGCIDTFVFVEGAHGAAVFIGQFNLCTNTQLLAASGSTTNSTFQIDKKLTSASLIAATIPVFDSVSGTTFNVSVSMAWTSTSPIGHENSTFHFHTKGFTENGHFNADFRDAVASGTVSDGTTNFTPSPSVFAQTMSAREVDVFITHP